MEAYFIVLGIAAIFVAFLIFSLMITYLRKGHHIESEIGDNRDMKARGIKCTSRTIMDEERAIFGDKYDDAAICSGNCGTCETTCSDQSC